MTLEDLDLGLRPLARKARIMIRRKMDFVNYFAKSLFLSEQIMDCANELRLALSLLLHMLPKSCGGTHHTIRPGWEREVHAFPALLNMDHMHVSLQSTCNEEHITVETWICCIFPFIALP